MKNWKRITAIGMAAAMTWGGSLSVLAASNDTEITAAETKSGQSITGTGTANSTVIDMKKYEVVLPTEAAITNALSYTVDPQGLVEATAAAAYGNDIEIGENNGVFFTNKSEDGTATVAVSGASDVLNITNKSTSGVSIEIKTQLTEAGSDAYAGGYSTTQDFSGTGDDATGLFLGVIGTGEFVKPIKDTADTFTNVVLSAADWYEVSYDSATSKYKYTLPTDADGLPTYGLQFVGAINPDAAETTWATYTTSPTTNIKQLDKELALPAITLIFKPTFIDAKPAMAVLDGETLYLGKIDAGDEGGFGTTKPTAVTVNGKTISAIGNNVDGYATVTWAEIYKAFGYPTEDKIPDAEALYGSINAIQFTQNGIDYYAEIK